MPLSNNLLLRFYDKCNKNKHILQILTPFGSVLKSKKWIFIIGCYNSGTTLLQSILTAHPQISGLHDEGVVFTDSLSRPEEFGWPRMWHKCLRDVCLDVNDELDRKAIRIKKQWSFWYSNKEPYLIEKSISNTARIRFLQHYFQPAFFIYIVRNGYAVSEGIQRKAKPNRWGNSIYGESYPIELCAEQWKTTDDIVEKDKAQIQNFLQIYYEELTENPKNVVNMVTEYLNITPLSASIFDANWSVHKVNSKIKNMNNKSLENLSTQDICKIESIAKETLIKHGY